MVKGKGKGKRKFIGKALDLSKDCSSQLANNHDGKVAPSSSASYAQPKERENGPTRVDPNISIPAVSKELELNLVTKCVLQEDNAVQIGELNISQVHSSTSSRDTAWSTGDRISRNLAPDQEGHTTHFNSRGRGRIQPLDKIAQKSGHYSVDIATAPNRSFLKPQDTSFYPDYTGTGPILNVEANVFVPKHVTNDQHCDEYSFDNTLGHSTNFMSNSDNCDIVSPEAPSGEECQLEEQPSSTYKNNNQKRSSSRNNDPNHGNARYIARDENNDGHPKPVGTHHGQPYNDGRRNEGGWQEGTSQKKNRKEWSKSRGNDDRHGTGNEDKTPPYHKAIQYQNDRESHNRQDTEVSNSRDNTKVAKNERQEKQTNYSHESYRNKHRQSMDKKKPSDPRLERERKSLEANWDSDGKSATDGDRRDSSGNNSSRKSWDNRIVEPRYQDFFNHSFEKSDEEYRLFTELYKKSNGKTEPVKVIEKEMDLFAMSTDYALAHCVAEDMRMGSGIAVSFKRKFKGLEDLVGQREKQGGLAYLEDNNRFIYYLVTKKTSSGKPTYQTFWSSLKKMRDHMIENKVKQLAIPRIGCGLDRLEWSKVSFMLEFLFRNADVQITVCNFQQMEDSVPQKDYYSNKLVDEYKPLVEIEEFTIILYYASEDGHTTKEMEALAKKFNFLQEFKRSPKHLGNPIRHEIKNHILYGCVVRKTEKSLFDFSAFGKCLFEVNKKNRKDEYEYVALQELDDTGDDLLNEKIVTLLRYHLKQVNIHICRAGNDNQESRDSWRS